MRLQIKWWLILSTGIMIVFILVWKGQTSEEISFNKDIRPIINAKCISCHGGVKQSGGFSFLFEEEAKSPTESGIPAIIPGQGKKSELVKRLTHSDVSMRMPLDREPLSEEEINTLAAWIDQGAKWEEHWAYIPPSANIDLPNTAYANQAANPIDNFVFAKLEEIDLAPSPKAEREILLRRVFLDLIGLPPTKEDYAGYLKDMQPTALEKMVDSLLQSPRFGEKWASMWLDLARYSDSKGYEKDLHRNIWKYRDWVIEAFNQDMPFDQFTIEQLAGDLLPDPSEMQLIATAFHRNTMANDEGGTNDEEFRVAAVLERVGTTFEVWQGTTMACVQCHSHPYDPITHEEFYKTMAIFNNTADKDLYNEQPKILTYETKDKELVNYLTDWLGEKYGIKKTGDEVSHLHEKKEKILESLDFRKVEAEEFQDKSRFIELVGHDQKSIWQVQDSSWIKFEGVDLSRVEAISFRYASLFGAIVEIRLDHPLGPKIGEVRLGITGKQFPANKPEKWERAKTIVQEVSGIHDIYYYFKKDRQYAQDLVRVDWIFYHEKEAAYNKLDRDAFEKLMLLEKTEPVHTPILRELPSNKRRKTYVFNRGDWRNPDGEVKPGVPASIGKANGEVKDRLDFANWLVDKRNPLTARVIVNRIWEQLFGFGLVETMEDFGSQGFKPSHPELLDWLAIQLMDKHGWQLKPFIKEIILSASYQQQSAVTKEQLEKDPYNKLLSRGSRTRLSAEVIRDQALFLSGLLSDKMQGPSVMPYQPEDIRDFSGQFWKESEGEDRYRRAVYTYWKRTNSYPSMITFDSPSREVCTSRRIRTNTPLQSLVLLNDPVYVEAAAAMARRIQRDYPDNPEKGIKESLQLITAISPQKEKVAALVNLYQETLAYYQEENGGAKLLEKEEDYQTAALTLVSNVMFNLDEFINRR